MLTHLLLDLLMVYTSSVLFLILTNLLETATSHPGVNFGWALCHLNCRLIVFIYWYGVFYAQPNSSIRFLISHVNETAVARAIYSASVVDCWLLSATPHHEEPNNFIKNSIEIILLQYLNHNRNQNRSLEKHQFFFF